MMPDMFQLFSFVLTAGAVYGGIRADLKVIHERIKEHGEAITGAHRRIDDLLTKGKPS